MTTADPLASIGPRVRNGERPMETRASLNIGHRTARRVGFGATGLWNHEVDGWALG
jgi:hypothetical protein